MTNSPCSIFQCEKVQWWKYSWVNTCGVLSSEKLTEKKKKKVLCFAGLCGRGKGKIMSFRVKYN